MTSLYRAIIPNRDLAREDELSKSGEVTTYKLTAEELAAYNAKHKPITYQRPIIPGSMLHGESKLPPRKVKKGGIE